MAGWFMVLRYEGSSDPFVQVWRKQSCLEESNKYFHCCRRKRISLTGQLMFLIPMCTTCSELPSNVSTIMAGWLVCLGRAAARLHRRAVDAPFSPCNITVCPNSLVHFSKYTYCIQIVLNIQYFQRHTKIKCKDKLFNRFFSSSLF